MLIINKTGQPIHIMAWGAKEVITLESMGEGVYADVSTNFVETIDGIQIDEEELNYFKAVFVNLPEETAGTFFVVPPEVFYLGRMSGRKDLLRVGFNHPMYPETVMGLRK